MYVTVEYPALPKGVTVKGEIYHPDELEGFFTDVVKVLEKFSRPSKLGAFIAKLRKAISPDVIKSITDKAFTDKHADAIIAGITAEAKKAG